MSNSKFKNFVRKNDGLRWEATRRMEFIEFRLYWEGKVNRSDLTDFFGISVPQASNDLSKYQEMAPKNIDYDRRGKFYFSTTEFTPIYYAPSSEHYLALLKQVSSGVLAENELFIKNLPNYDLIPVLERPIAPDRLKTVLDSIKNDIELKILYQSMSRQNPLSRWIAPKSLAYDGYRWNIRAYCFTRKRFMDFNVGRIWEIEDKRKTTFSKEDSDWDTKVVLKIGPNPGLSEDQKKTIEMEYGMKNRIKEVEVRLPFLSYFLKRYGLDNEKVERSAQSQHIVILNPEVIPENFTKIG